MLHFMDTDNRYIGKRERLADEETPPYATEIPLDIVDGKQAHFVNGAWVVSDIPYVAPPPEEPHAEYTPEEIADMVAALAALGVTL